MANIRVFACVFLVLVMLTCVSARPQHRDRLRDYEKRLFSSCADLGASCSNSLFGTKCCGNYNCHDITKKCVKSSGSWVGDRNGK
ncbi:unnamed protein product [Adineta ricciae]|uniref:Uncharacterized protein n=1 Tax=Adineta ricciae TaxID=249248 RepID=A0A813PAF1_ADIRI|nr:unnamed protein product [Adineta ricciae]CAF1308075.1 unnamed protein product [Adineta ricciae]